jgi:large subunit ribosomal protein L12
MEYVYAALLLHESGGEINEDAVTSVLDAASVDVDESRVKALVAALEDVDIEDAVEEAAAVPAGGAGGAAPATEEEAEDAADEEEAEEAAADEEAEDAADEGDDDEEEETSGEGLGDLFG